MACFERDWEIGIDGDSVSDWDRAFAGYGATGRGASDVAGGDFVDFGGGYVFMVDTCGLDFALAMDADQERSRDPHQPTVSAITAIVGYKGAEIGGRSPKRLSRRFRELAGLGRGRESSWNRGLLLRR